MSKINIRESLNRLDIKTDNKYDLRNTYDCSIISDDKKKELAEALNKNASAKTISRILGESLYPIFMIEFIDDGRVYQEEYEAYDSKDAVEQFRMDYPREDGYEIKYIYKLTPEGYERIELYESLDDEVLYENDKFKIIYDGQFYNLIGKENNEIYALYYNLDDAKDDAIKDPFYESLTESLDLSEVEEVKELPFDNKRVNNLRGIFSTKDLVDALNKTGLDKFKIRTSRLKNVSQGDIKDAWMDLKRKGWSVSITRDDSLKGFNEVYVFEKTINESLNEAINAKDSMVAQEFNYTMQYGDQSSDVNAAVIIIPGGLMINGEPADLTVYAEDENGEVINFKSVEEANDWINKYKDDVEFHIEQGNELHATPSAYYNSFEESLAEAKKVGSNKISQGMNLPGKNFELVKITDGIVSSKDRYECIIYSKELDSNKDYGFYQGEVIFEYDDPQLIDNVFPDEGTKVKLAIYKVPEDDPDHDWTGDYFVDYIDETNESLAEDFSEVEIKAVNDWNNRKRRKYGYKYYPEKYYGNFNIYIDGYKLYYPEDIDYSDSLADTVAYLKSKIKSGEIEFAVITDDDIYYPHTDEHVELWRSDNRFGEENYGYNPDIIRFYKNKSYNEDLDEEQLYKIVCKSGASEWPFESALSYEDAEKIVDYYNGRWIDERGFEWSMEIEEDDESTERVYPFDESLKEDTGDFDKWLADLMNEPDEYVMGFNEWLLDKYGVTSDDMTDDDYDYYFKKYVVDYYRNTEEGKDYPIPESLEEDNEDEEDFEYDDSDEVEEGVYFFADGENYAWVERIAGPVHLDFDNWAVWSAREIVPIQDFIIRKNEQGGYDIDKDAYIAAINSKPIVYFVVDEDTGFIDWGPVENQTEAQDFLNSKIEDYENDEELEIEEESLHEKKEDNIRYFPKLTAKETSFFHKEGDWDILGKENSIYHVNIIACDKYDRDGKRKTKSIEDNDTEFLRKYGYTTEKSARNSVRNLEDDFDIEIIKVDLDNLQESLQESKAIKNDDDFEVTLHYDDIGDGKEYDYKLGYDEVVSYLKEIAWSNGDGPEDASEDEYLEWVMDNFDELAGKYESNVLNYFESEASQYEYDHRNDEP